MKTFIVIALMLLSCSQVKNPTQPDDYDVARIPRPFQRRHLVVKVPERRHFKRRQVVIDSAKIAKKVLDKDKKSIIFTSMK